MKQYDGIKDEELISRFKNGESEILAYQEHGPCFLADHVLVFFHQIVEDF